MNSYLSDCTEAMDSEDSSMTRVSDVSARHHSQRKNSTERVLIGAPQQSTFQYSYGDDKFEVEFVECKQKNAFLESIKDNEEKQIRAVFEW